MIKMNLEIKNKVASGLRRMKVQPDFFIFLPQPNWTWDEETILGIPVYHCSSMVIRFIPYSDTECPFIPCNFKEKIEGFLNIYKAKDGCIRVVDPLYSSRPEADEYAGGNRIACIFVSFEEGEGL